jgi:hypothetical protein
VYATCFLLFAVFALPARADQSPAVWRTSFDLKNLKRESSELRDLPDALSFRMEYFENLGELASTSVEWVMRDVDDDNLWENICQHRFEVSLGELRIQMENTRVLQVPLVAEMLREEPQIQGKCVALTPRAFLEQSGTVSLRLSERSTRARFSPYGLVTPKLEILALYAPIQIRLREEGDSFIPSESLDFSALLAQTPAELTFSIEDYLHWTRPAFGSWVKQ